MPVRTTRLAWRVHALTATLALAFAGVVAVIPAAVASPATVFASGLRLNHANQIGSVYGSVVTGEVENMSTRTLETVRVMLDQLDAAGNVLGSTTAFALAERLDPGERTAFKGYLLPVPGFVTWNVRNVLGDFAIKPANHNFTLAVTGSYLDEYGFRHVQGTVRNDNTGPASAVTVNAQFFDGAATTDAEWTYPDSDLTMAPGEIAPFEIMRVDGVPHTSVVFSADANNDPSPLPTAVSVSGGGSAAQGKAVGVTAHVVKRGTDAPVPGVGVELLGRDACYGSWNLWGTGVSDSAGKVTFSPQGACNRTFRARVPAAGAVLGSESSNSVVGIYGAPVSLSASPSTVVGSTALFDVWTQAEGKITIQMKKGKRWIDVAKLRTKKKKIKGGPTANGTVEVVVPVVGKVRFRAVSATTTMNGPGISNVVVVKAWRTLTSER